jgi:putative transposase
VHKISFNVYGREHIHLNIGLGIYPSHKTVYNLNMGKVTRFNLDNYCHFVTSKTYRNTKIFSERKVADLLIQTIFEVKKKLKFQLVAFVVMPDHIHLMVVPDKRNSISDVMRHIKGRFSRRYNYLSRRMNSSDYETLNQRAGNSSQPKPKVWQASFYDHVIRNGKEFVERINYIYNNPVRANLAGEPEDYEYSSATGKFDTDLDTYVGG